MSEGINIIKNLHGKILTVTTTWAAANVAYTAGTELNCQGYSKLLVVLIATSNWNRAGTITTYGSLWSGGTYVKADASVTNDPVTVTATASFNIYLVIEPITPYVKFDWTNTTPGDAGTLSMYAMPFNG